MNLNFIIGRAGSGKTFFCINKIKNILQNSPLDSKIFFLLPAYQTYRAELELVKISGGSVNTQMMSFQRFSKKILEEVGGAIIPRISEIGRRLLLRKILISHAKADDLKFYKKSANQRGFAENLAQELNELRTYSITPEILRKIKIDDDELSDKIFDLANLSEDFRKIIENKQNDESDLLEKAADLIKFSADIKKSEIFIDGFIFFDPQQRKILSEIFKYAKNIYITLPMDTKIFCNENKNMLGIFNRAFKTYEFLKNLAADLKIDCETIFLENPKRFESAELAFIEKNIFKKNPEKFVGANKNFKIISAVNKRVEIESVAREIIKMNRENFRFREIGIIARDDSYNDLIKNIFEIHRIPFYIDDKKSALNHQFAEFIRSALEILHGFRAESIFRCIRTGFFKIPAEKIDLIENYVIEFGIRGEKIWSENWTKHKHKFYKTAEEDFSENEKLRLKEINLIREKISESLIKFAENMKKKKSAREFVIALYEFIEKLKISEQLAELSKNEENRGNLSLSREHLKIWDDVIKLFEQISDSLGDEKINFREFEMIINEGLDALEMSIIPPGIDEVTISKFDQNSLQNSRAIFILGFNDVNFPKKAEEKFLLSDADRLHLNDCGIEISKGGQESIFAEKFLIYRGLTEAKNFLQISYTLADSEGRAMQPSKFIEKLKNLFSIGEINPIQIEILNNLGSEKDFLIEDKKINSETAKKLFAPNKKIRSSISKFQIYNECPFKYFAKFGLELQERAEYKINPPDIGNILHEVMKNFGENLKKEKKLWRDVGDDELKNRVEKIIDNLTSNINNKILLSNSSYRHRRERIKKVAISSLKRLIELDKVSEFHPELFEENFDNLNKIFEFKISGVELELVGVIDRIDFNKNYFMVIDYKTGKAYLDLNEIFIGVNLQLITYLFAAKNSEKVGDRMPAAILYYFLKYPSERGNNLADSDKKISDDLKMVGMVLNDKKIIFEIDSSGNFIKTKKSEYDKEFFEALEKFVKNIFCNTCEKILRGEIFVKPFQSKKKNSCDYCIYSELCGFNEKTDEICKSELNDDEIIKRILEQ